MLSLEWRRPQSAARLVVGHRGLRLLRCPLPRLRNSQPSMRWSRKQLQLVRSAVTLVLRSCVIERRSTHKGCGATTALWWHTCVCSKLLLYEN